MFLNPEDAIPIEFEDEEEIEEILKLLLNPQCNIHEYDANDRCIILMTYDLSSLSYFEMLVREYSPTLNFNIDTIQILLRTIIADRDSVSLSLVLGKCITENCDNDSMVRLATESLKSGNNELINAIFQFTSKTNLLKNGETFMTNLFKENIDEAIIKRVIEMELFDLNAPNAIEETALTLACDRLMADTVKCLLDYGSDESYKDHIALERTILAKTNQPYKENEANTIKTLLMNAKNGALQKQIEQQYRQQYGYNHGQQYGQQYGYYNAQQYGQQNVQQYVQPVVQNVEPARRKNLPNGDNEKKVLNIMRLLLTNHGDLMKVDDTGQCALYMAYMMTDKRFYNMFIDNCPTEIDFLGNQQGLAVLEKMIDGNQMDTLKSSLAIAVIDQKYDRDLLALALRMLVKKMDDQYPLIVKLCYNVNVVMKNNETFVTSLFKNNISSDTITTIILSNKFDVNIPNGSNETPLMLACERLLPDVVDLLMNSGADISHDTYKAVDFLVNNKTSLKDPQARNDAKRRIMELIIKKEKPFRSKEISIRKRLFKNVDINSKVIYYDQHYGKLVPLYGTVRWSGVDNNNRLMYGIELNERNDKATDGTFKNMRLFNCKPFHGLVVPIEEVAPDHEFIDDVVVDEMIEESEISDIQICCIPKVYFRRQEIGIQGHSHNGFVESLIFAIFAKSFVLDFYLSPIQYTMVDISKNFKNLLSWSIVYPLREFGFVSFHKIKHLENVFLEINENVDRNMKKDSDLETFTEALLKLCPAEPLLRFINYNYGCSSAMFLRFGFTSYQTIESFSSQEMLEITMSERAITFLKIPGCLMLELPENVRKTLNCSRIIPLRTINISPLLFHTFRHCTNCYTKASFQCLKCVKGFLSVRRGLFCGIHKCTQNDVTKLPQFNGNTKSHCIMDLKAIIYWNIDRYVTYVKEDRFTNNWLRYNCCSKKNPINNSSVPTVAVSNNVTNFLNKNEFDMLEDIHRFYDPDVECLLKNARILVYESANVDCY